MIYRSILYIIVLILINNNTILSIKPVAVATWNFGKLAIDRCIPILENGSSSINAVEEGIKYVELDNNDQYYVGIGGLPNADGDMEFDAAIMDSNKRYGAVMALKNIKTPISIARSVMEKCIHNVICGDGALKWAIANGYIPDENVLTIESKKEWMAWKYENEKHLSDKEDMHDTIGLICLDKDGHLCAGTSTSGWKFKHPGRVGDSPLIGSGLYCDGKIGAAVATGDGEEIMRLCLSFLTVELMRQGHEPNEACRLAIERFQELEPNELEEDKRMHKQLTVGLIAMNKDGKVGAASTLSQKNMHRGKPYFPVMCWRGGNDNNNHCQELQADSNGATF